MKNYFRLVQIICVILISILFMHDMVIPTQNNLDSMVQHLVRSQAAIWYMMIVIYAEVFICKEDKEKKD